ncbi:MAG: GNAT family N-acetyltransferase [Candidatus Thermoplasmatota archaeon]|nr:GNAT family N-acetyltransferase [Candidatus Thermoplasmatota archaeon]
MLKLDHIPKLLEKLIKLDSKEKFYFNPHPFKKEQLTKNYFTMKNKKDDFYFVLINPDNNDIIGYSMLRTFGKFEIPTFGIVIFPPYRGKNFGNTLTKLTLQQAQKIGYKKVKLRVNWKNKAALMLYKKNGFKLTEHEIWMEKSL